MSAPHPSTCPRCGSATLTGRLGVCARCLLADEPGPAETMAGLVLEEEIGRGGMGTVWRARDVRLGRAVAVKFLPDALAGDPAFRARFEREARAMAMLEHHGIVAVHDLREEDGQVFLVMELVDGIPLSRMLPLAPDRAVEIAAQVCDALAYAHARGVVHRDVKPENVLVDREGRAKLADFGIARLLRGDAALSPLTRTGDVLGTPHYMAPEALAGAPADPRMDLFSLGVVLHQALTGRLPVGTPAHLPPPLDAIVAKALAHDPAARYPAAAAMRADLLAATRIAALPSGGYHEDERLLARAVALVGTAALGVTLWAALVSVTPKVLRPDEVGPLVMLAVERLADGRILSRARFEPGPTLAAVAVLGLSFAAWAALRRHWRKNGLHEHAPDRPLPEGRRVALAGAATFALYLVRLALDAAGATWANVYLPILGGLCEVAVLYLFLETVLESQRTRRPLARERLALAGVALALVPPVTELLRFLVGWTPPP